MTVFKEVINHYLNRNTNVYCCFIDATKAFDWVHFGILFNILLSRGIPAIILRLLLHLYTSQKVFVKWQDSISSCFNVQNGVRQGAIISSLLFTLYIDVLISRLKDSGIGCAISNTYYGAFGYADDVALLSPSRKGLQILLYICEEYGNEFHVQFNTAKTVCMYMCRNKIKPNEHMYLYKNKLEWVDSFKYLGTFITPDLKDCTDISHKRGQFISSVNNLITSFRNVSCHLLNKLFDCYCCSFYGCQSWFLGNQNLIKFGTAYNKSLRKIWGLPFNTHTNIVLSIADKSSFID